MQPELQSKQAEDDRTINLGVIGCGKHCVHSHLTKMGEEKSVSLAAVFDPSSASVQDLSRFSLAPKKAFASEEELLLSSAEAVFVMSPDEFHADSLARAVRAHKHVFVEKPLATDARQLETVIEALRFANDHNLIVSSCHPRRFDPPFTWLKVNLAQLTQDLGAVSHFEFDFSYHKPSKDWKHHRGLLLDHINHEIDLVHWYFGHAPFTAWKLADGPTHYHVAGVRDDGVHFSFNGSRQLESRIYREFMRVRYERGTLTMDTNQGEVTIHNHDSGKRFNFSIQGIDYDKRFKLVNENFIQAIQGRVDNYLTLQDLYVNTALSVKLTEENMWRYGGETI